MHSAERSKALLVHRSFDPAKEEEAYTNSFPRARAKKHHLSTTHPTERFYNVLEVLTRAVRNPRSNTKHYA